MQIEPKPSDMFSYAFSHNFSLWERGPLICSEPGCDPTTSWCYRDEDAGGPISKVCRMRGRWNNLTYWSKHAFEMFYMKYELPKIQKYTPR